MNNHNDTWAPCNASFFFSFVTTICIFVLVQFSLVFLFWTFFEPTKTHPLQTYSFLPEPLHEFAISGKKEVCICATSDEQLSEMWPGRYTRWPFFCLSWCWYGILNLPSNYILAASPACHDLRAPVRCSTASPLIPTTNIATFDGPRTPKRQR